MPPAEPTTATTWIVGGSILPAIGPREESADRLRLPAGLLGNGLEALPAALGSRFSDPLGKTLAELRALLQGAERDPEGDTAAFGAAVDRRPARRRISLECLGVERRTSAFEAHFSTILSHVDLLRKAPDRRSTLRKSTSIEGRTPFSCGPRTAHPAAGHYEVPIRRRDVDPTALEPLAASRLECGQRAGARDDVREPALGTRMQVEDDADGRVEILGQPVGERRERLDTSRGRSHDDQVRRRLVHPDVVSPGGPAKQRVGCGPEGNRRDMMIVAALAAVVGTLALFAVFVFWGAGNSSAALPYFAVPGVLFGTAALLGSRANL